jgi:RNA polymerase sigma-70 factor (ECF subfamily)
MNLTTDPDYDDDQGMFASRIRTGDKIAFRHFYNLYSKKIYGFALSYLKSKSEAEEIIQTVFVKIWETRDDIRDGTSLKSYLYKITVNHIYNYLKYKKVRSTAAADLLASDSDNSTLEKIYYNNLEENIHLIIEQLPEQRRVIFKLSRLEGLPHDEIAKRMQISVRTVESQIYKALKFLKKNLNEELLLLIFLLPL